MSQSYFLKSRQSAQGVGWALCACLLSVQVMVQGVTYAGQASVSQLPMQVPTQIDMPALALDEGVNASKHLKASNTPKKEQPKPTTPKLDRPVIDEVGILSDSQVANLTKKLHQLHHDGLAQTAIVIVPTTNGVPIFDYAFETASRFGLGKKGVDNGLLILVAVNDRQLFILTGYGLEGDLPDSIVKRVIDNDITPYFKKKEYANGLMAGLISLESRLNKGALPQSVTLDNEVSESSSGTESLFGYFLLSLIVGLILMNKVGRTIGASVGAIGFFVLSLNLGWLGIGIGAIGAIVIFCLIYFLLGVVAQSSDFRYTKRPHRHGGNQFGTKGFGSNNRPYGGGGGRFGGGGAGGSW